MKRLALASVLLASTALCQEAIRLEATQAGKHFGHALLTQTILADGSKSVQIVLVLDDGEQRARITQEALYDRDGAPLRMLQEVRDAEGKRKQLTTVTFDAAGARMRTETGEDAKEKNVPLVTGAPRNDPSQFWFVRDVPKLHGKVVFYRFDIGQARWVLAEVEYLGPTRFHGPAGEVDAQQIRTDTGRYVVDAKGSPLLLESGKLLLKRAGKSER